MQTAEVMLTVKKVAEVAKIEKVDYTNGSVKLHAFCNCLAVHVLSPWPLSCNPDGVKIFVSTCIFC